LAQAAAFVAETIATVTVLLIQIFATAINFVISEIGKLIKELKDLVQSLIDFVEPILTEAFCVICTICCKTPLVSCPDNQGASCCCVDGCGHCGSGQYNVCNGETSC
jgi:phosphomevalonate kinase